MKDKFNRTKQFVKDHTVPFAVSSGAVVGSVATVIIFKKSHLLDVKDVKNVYWWTSVSPDLIAKTLTENGRAIFDCDHCDRTLTLIDPLHE